jgi:2,4-dienoyl-CoA reductase (NADPH2)
VRATAVVDTLSLATPLRLGRSMMPNRIALAPMTVSYANADGTVSPRAITHLRQRASGGAGLILTEHFTVSEAGRQLPHQTIVDGPDKLPGLTALADAVHAEGSLIVAQIGHAGRYGGPWSQYQAAPRLAPSAVAFPLIGERIVTPTAMSAADIAATVDDIATAAALLVRAGFDGVQLHASQGFLPSQFLSPRMNHRDDDYGGDFDNRVRFVMESVAAIRSAVGAEPIVGVQLLADEYAHGGWSLFDALQLAELLQAARVDFLLPSVTTFETVRKATEHGQQPRWGHQLGTAIALAAAVSIPVFANGGIADPAFAGLLVSSQLVAGVALARPMLADPAWARKALTGRAEDIRTCACDPPQCLQTQLQGVTCSSWETS